MAALVHAQASPSFIGNDYCELTYQGSCWVGDIYFSHGQQSDNVAHAALVPTLLHYSVLILIAS